ncbi:thermonuclease family protein [Thauera mechernichensis]
MTGGSALVVGLVVAIADGDTLTLVNEDFRQIKVRLAEIDAPKMRQAFGARSRQSLAEVCYKKRAVVRGFDVDRYQRVVGRVKCDGKDANAAQVRRGMAWVYDQYAKDKTLYRLQDEARSAGRGLWADQHHVAPWDWRRGGATGETLRGTLNPPSCSHAARSSVRPVMRVGLGFVPPGPAEAHALLMNRLRRSTGLDRVALDSGMAHPVARDGWSASG